MTLPDIALAILERRNRLSPIIIQGELQAAIGTEAFQEALDRRWIIPDSNTGHLHVSNLNRMVLEMENEADSIQVGDNVLTTEDGKTYNAAVAERRPDGTYVLSFGGKEQPRDPKKAFQRGQIQLVSRAGTKPGTPEVKQVPVSQDRRRVISASPVVP
jgi:hypothetical protein